MKQGRVPATITVATALSLFAQATWADQAFVLATSKMHKLQVLAEGGANWCQANLRLHLVMEAGSPDAGNTDAQVAIMNRLKVALESECKTAAAAELTVSGSGAAVGTYAATANSGWHFDFVGPPSRNSAAPDREPRQAQSAPQPSSGPNAASSTAPSSSPTGLPRDTQAPPAKTAAAASAPAPVQGNAPQQVTPEPSSSAAAAPSQATVPAANDVPTLPSERDYASVLLGYVQGAAGLVDDDAIQTIWAGYRYPQQLRQVWNQDFKLRALLDDAKNDLVRTMGTNDAKFVTLVVTTRFDNYDFKANRYPVSLHFNIYPDSVRIRAEPLAKRREPDSTVGMIRAGFLDPESRRDLIELARDGSAAHRLARRANALVLLDQGMSCSEVAKVLLLDDDTVRTWYRLYEEEGFEGLASFGYDGSACRLSDQQQDRLKAWITETLPQTTGAVGAWIEKEYGIVYESRSGLVALLHRLGMEHRKPKAVSSKLDPGKQAAFIKKYENLLNSIGDDEAVLFGDAVHPTHAVRPVGCWAPKDVPIAVPQSSGRQRLNIHGAIDLETGKTRMIEAATVNAISTIMLLKAIEAMYPGKRLIHLFVDNARYHHAKLVQAWLVRPGCRIKLHFIPTYCPHLDPIERLWGLMHKHVTHNRCHATFADFKAAILTFLREEVPRKWGTYCDQVTDNFRIISPKDFRVLA